MSKNLSKYIVYEDEWPQFVPIFKNLKQNIDLKTYFYPNSEHLVIIAFFEYSFPQK